MCREIARKEQNKQNTEAYREKWGIKNRKKWLGTGNLGGTMNPNPKEEKKMIKAEKKLFGLI